MIATIGIDPSLTGTGVVVLVDGKLKEKALIKTKPDVEKTPVNELKRLLNITSKIQLITNKYTQYTEMVVIEGLSFGARNTTALIQLSGLNYLIRKLLYELNIPFTICAPTTLKKFICGKGNAQKDLVMMKVYKRYNVTLTNDNEADAYVMSRIADALVREVKLTTFQKEVINLLKQQL